MPLNAIQEEKMKKFQLLFYFSLLSIVLVACSSKSMKFDDKDIEIGLINVDSTNDYKIYSIEIKNNGKIDLYFIDLYLSYPIKQQNGWKGNPYKVEGETDEGKPINLKANETIQFTVITPINEVFGDPNLLVLEHPYLDLHGFTRDGDNYIPFGITKGM
jgi:hypothetical protein